MVVDKTYMVDAPESRENVNDMFAVTNVLEKDTIEHNDKTSTELNTILFWILAMPSPLKPATSEVKK